MLTSTGCQALADSRGMYKIYLTNDGLLISAINATKSGILKILETGYVCKFQPKKGAPKTSAAYTVTCRNDVPCIVLPREILLREDKLLHDPKYAIIDVMRPIVKLAASLEICLAPFPEQEQISNYIVTLFEQKSNDFLDRGTSCALLDMRAGYGKTMIAALIIAKLSVKTAYIVLNKYLAQQAADDFAKYLGGNYIEAIDIVVINSALNKLERQKYSLVIFDEVHAYCSNKRKDIFTIANSPYMLGMTASSNHRRDGFDMIAHKWLCRVIRAEDIVPDIYEFEMFDKRALIVNYYGAPEYTQTLRHESTGEVFVHYMHQQFIADNVRNVLLTKMVVTLYNARVIIGVNIGESENAAESATIFTKLGVFVDSIEFGHETARFSCAHTIMIFMEELDMMAVAYDMIIKELGGDGANDSIFAPELAKLRGGISAEERDAAIDRARILFTTYGYGGTGISVQRVTAIVFWQPRLSGMIQLMGRNLRRGSNTKMPRIVIDMVDKNTCLKKQYNTRCLAYDYYGHKLNQIKFNATAQNILAEYTCAINTLIEVIT